MNISISHAAPPVTEESTPDFPLIRFETNLTVYEEALINGRYLGVGWSAMGRPKSRQQVGHGFARGEEQWQQLASLVHAFSLEVDGQLLSDRWQWVGSEEVISQCPGCREMTATLKHTLRPVTVRIHTRLDGTPFLVRWLEIANTGDRPAALAQVFPWAGLVWVVGDPYQSPLQVPAPFTLGRFRSSEWGIEGEFDWESLPDGALRIASLRGVSGHNTPFFILRNEVTGEALMVDFACSGNWQAEFHNDHEPSRRPFRTASLYARVGLAGPAPVRVLSPGETVTTPPVHLGHLTGDLDTCAQALHEHLRRSVIPALPEARQHPVECNHTGYLGNDRIAEAEFLEQVDLAADVGCELFIVDAGWFGDAGRSWWELVGDWEENPLLPRGLKPVFDRARQHAMLCGLWVEVERAGPASKTYQAHPEWLMKRRGGVIPQLDLAKPEVARHVEETIVRLVEKHELDCFRLDYNIRVGEGAEEERDGFAESTMWRYYDALHAIFERLRQRFPDLILENCSSGGGRNDLGMLSRFHWTQLSDNWSPVPALKILNGMTLALPPEQCLTWLGAMSPGVADLDFMLRIGLFNHFAVAGIFPTMGERNAAARERWRHAIQLFKTFVRPMLSTCRVFHHTPIQRSTEPGEWCVLEYAAEDASQAYAGVFRLAGAGADTYHLYPRGLDASRRYRVTNDNNNTSRNCEGGDLMERGLRVRIPGGLQSELLVFEAI